MLNQRKTIKNLCSWERFTGMETYLLSNPGKFCHLMNSLPTMTYRRCNDQYWTLDFVGENCEQVIGYHIDQLISDQNRSYLKLIHPQDREFVDRQMQGALQEQISFHLVYRIITLNHQEKWIWDQGNGIFSSTGELLGTEGLIVDISQFKRAEEELELLEKLIKLINVSQDFESALKISLSKLCEATGWDFGEAWIPNYAQNILECNGVWYGSTEILDKFRQKSMEFTFSLGKGLPGKVWLTQKSEWIINVSSANDQTFYRHKLAQECGLKSGFFVPIIYQNNVVAVLGFFMFASKQEDERLVELISAIATQLGVIMHQKKVEAQLLESQRRLSTLINYLPGMLFYCNNNTELGTDLSDLSLTYVSEGSLALTGYKNNEFIGDRSVSLDAITDEEDLPKVRKVMAESLKNKQNYEIEYRILTKDKEEKWVLEKGGGIFNEKGEMLGLEGFITDITESKRSQEALKQAEIKYRSIFENAIEGIFQTTLDGHYISANPALARIYGYDSPGELMAHLKDISNQLYVQPNRREEFISILQKQDIVADFESQVYRKDGEIIWIAENARAVHDGQGNLMYYEGTVEDITELKKNKEQLFYHAFYDNVTGLANRALFMDRLGNAVTRAKRNKNYLFAVLFLDLDRFKLVNDSLGHLVGDKLLIGIARRLEKCLRTIDTVARLGGDEFTIILDDIADLKSAIYVADRINQELKRAFYIEGNEIFSGTSIGIVINGQKMGENYPLYEKPEDLLRDADTALYRAKNLGKSRYEVFDITMHEKAVEILQLETDLRHALERGELQIYYQPCLSLFHQKITGFEALLRWEHPQKGLIMPDQFLSIAEETGLIVPIGYWILEQVLHQLFIWKKMFNEQDLTVSVNLTDKQFMQSNLSLQIHKILVNYGLSGGDLILEIGENCLIKNSSLAYSIIEDLNKQSIQVCLDNFGQGYTSLNLLHQFPLNILKLDHSFFNGEWNGVKCTIDNSQYQSDNLQQIQQQSWDYQKQIVRGIVMLAVNLGMKVVANNVETFNQLNLVQEINCQYVQGNLFFPPLNVENATQLIMDSDPRIEY